MNSNTTKRMRVGGILLAMFSNTVTAATPAQLTTAQVNGVAWLIQSQAGNGNWSAGTGSEVIATSAALSALSQAGMSGFPSGRGITWMRNAHAISTDALARQTAALYKAGVDTGSISQFTAALYEVRNSSGYWGAFAEYAGSFPDTALALLTYQLVGAASVYGPPNSAISFVQSTQNADGGWSYTPTAPATTPVTLSTASSSILPTAYAILALHQYKSTYSVQSNITAALNWLKSKQKVGGGFGDGTYGTVIETAVANLALASELGSSDPYATSAENFLIAQQGADGSWGGDALATSLALQILPATVYPDTDGDGIPDEVESILGMNPYEADTRWLANSGNGESVPGLTVPTVLSSTILNQSFSLTLASGSGTGPFTWRIVAGTLPTGLTLNATSGMISGTPTVQGSHSFEYAVTDAQNNVTTVLAQIDINGGSGDLNADAVVDVADVALALRMALGLMTPTTTQLGQGDVNSSGSVDISDVTQIQLKSLGLASQIP